MLINVVAFTLASLLTRKIRGTNALRTVFFMPNLIGGIVLGYVWQLLINGILINFGVDITFSPRYGFWGLVVLTNWQMAGYMMVIYIAAIQAIPPEVIEGSQDRRRQRLADAAPHHHPAGHAGAHDLHVLDRLEFIQALRSEPLPHRWRPGPGRPPCWRWTSSTPSMAETGMKAWARPRP